LHFFTWLVRQNISNYSNSLTQEKIFVKYIGFYIKMTKRGRKLRYDKGLFILFLNYVS